MVTITVEDKGEKVVYTCGEYFLMVDGKVKPPLSKGQPVDYHTNIFDFEKLLSMLYPFVNRVMEGLK